MISTLQVAARLGIAGTDQVGRENAVAGGAVSRTTFSLSRGCDRVARGVERGGSEAAAEVGDAHAREHPAADRIGRIGARAAQDRRAHARRLQASPRPACRAAG